MTAPYRLVRPAPPASDFVPDDAQRRVLEHGAGPLLVLAGPGTGKTATMVELVARRVEGADGRPPLDPDRVLALTFSRRSAGELRERLASRLGVPTTGPGAWTFHSYCYALVRRHQPEALWTSPLQLLSGPEQDVVLRELLRGTVVDGREWPAGLRPAVPTRGFAQEVRTLAARVRALGLDPADLAGAGRAAGRPEWSALASFLDDYLDVLDAQGAVDYAELVHRAVLLAETPEVAEVLRREVQLVVVDEYQDTDPAQERLLQALIGGGRDLVVVGDPDQAIYAFRGAEVGGLLDFPQRFRRADGSPAPVVSLRTCRRSGAALLEVSRRVAALVPAPGLPVADLLAHRDLSPAPGADPGSVEARTYPSTGAEAEAVADLLRREHLENGTPWDRMAVLVRSGARSVPLLRRVLVAAGVPVEVAGDEVPLAVEPAVAPLLAALRAAVDPEGVTVEDARALLLSPLGGADPRQVRRLGRHLRARDAAADGPRPSDVLLRAALLEPALLADVPADVAAPATRLAALLGRASDAAAEQGAEAALWTLWSGSPWPQRLAQAAAGGGAAARSADRDLDAVVALFASFARAEERRGGRAGAEVVVDLLAAQQIPGDTLADKASRGAAVRVLTAHRSKGLEWDVVVVCGVQEGVWPDLRRRSTLLEVDRLGPDGQEPPVDRATLLADERRLFYVALTRARRRCVVTAVLSPDDDGDRPSRLLAECGVPVQQHTARTGRALSLTALVADLRRLAVDPEQPEVVRRAAAQRLARLAAARDDAGRPLVRAADPQQWWGLLDLPEGSPPVHPEGAPVVLSASAVAALAACPLRFFLERRAAAQTATSVHQSFGLVVHALAREAAQATLEGRPEPDLPALLARLDAVWGQLGFEAPWRSAQQRREAEQALRAFLAWHHANPRRLHAAEAPFDVQVDLAGTTVRLRGSMDRVEVSEPSGPGDPSHLGGPGAAGAVVVVDLKTAKSPKSASDAEQDPQLGVYQWAVQHGAVPDAGTTAGGAELLYVRGGPSAAVRSQKPLPADGGFALAALEEAARRVVAEDFPPTPSAACDRCPQRRACPTQPLGRQVVS